MVSSYRLLYVHSYTSKGPSRCQVPVLGGQPGCLPANFETLGNHPDPGRTEGAGCETDVQHYIQVCDPGGNVDCIDNNCVARSVDAGVTPDAGGGFDGGGNAVEGDLMLSNGGSRDGRLLVFHDGQWGTVCDDNWTTTTASIACSQLFGAGTTGSFSTDEGYGEIWLDGLNCSGSEARLADCPHNGWGVNDCSHSEDVYLTCN